MKLLFGGLLVIAVFTFLGVPVNAEPHWTNTPTVWTKQKSYTSISQLPKNIDSTYNRDCTETKAVTRSIHKGFLEQSSLQCVASSSFGSTTSSCMLQRSGTRQYGPLYNSTRQPLCILAAPSNSAAIVAKNVANYGMNYDIYPVIDQHLLTNTSDAGTISHTLRPEVWTLPVADKSGKRIPLIPDSIAFSDNGNWMIADSPTVGHVRVDLRNGSVTPFSSTIAYNSASNPGWQTAVSPSGRYAVMYSREFNTFKVFDIQSCASVPDIITGPVACHSRNLLPENQASMPSLIAISRLRFKGENHLTLTSYTRPGGVLKIESGYITITGTGLPNFDYLALGDSFASGEGAYDYKSSTADGQNNCHVSFASYAFLLGKQLGYGGYNSVACSGALLEDVLSPDKAYMGQSQPRKTVSEQDESKYTINFTPGFIAQWKMSEKHTPKAITVSISGNDIGFGGIIARCVMPGECYKSERSRIEKLNEIEAASEKLGDTYQKLLAAHPEIRIYAVGYPKIINPDGNCAANVLLDENERKFANQLVDHLNGMIERTAKSKGVHYVDVSNALAGHQLCDNNFDLGVNGMTDNYDISRDRRQFDFFKKPYATESYHPNKKGHELLAAAIKTKTSNLTAPMPEPVYTPAPAINRQLPILIHYTGTYSPIIDRIITENPGIDVIKRGQQLKFDIATKLLPNTTSEFVLHSDPISLGAKNTDQSGILSVDVTIPDGVPAGFHTLRISSLSLAGEPVIIERVVYVAGSEPDIDDDGILNDSDDCVFIPGSSGDTDGDLLQDVCDGTISEPKAEEVITLPPDTTVNLPIIRAPETPAEPDPQTEPQTDTRQDEPEATPIPNPATGPVGLVAVATNQDTQTTPPWSGTVTETPTSPSTNLEAVGPAVLAAQSINTPPMAAPKKTATYVVATIGGLLSLILGASIYAWRRTT